VADFSQPDKRHIKIGVGVEGLVQHRRFVGMHIHPAEQPNTTLNQIHQLLIRKVGLCDDRPFDSAGFCQIQNVFRPPDAAEVLKNGFSDGAAITDKPNGFECGITVFSHAFSRKLNAQRFCANNDNTTLKLCLGGRLQQRGKNNHAVNDQCAEK